MDSMTVDGESAAITTCDLSRRTGEVIKAVAETGTPVTVTLNGRPCVAIVPIPKQETHIERMIREGTIARPRRWRANCSRGRRARPQMIVAAMV